MNLYAVHTERFGIILREDDSIKTARQWAKAALGVMNPSCVRRVNESATCERCESKPCTCRSPPVVEGPKRSR